MFQHSQILQVMILQGRRPIWVCCVYKQRNDGYCLFLFSYQHLRIRLS